MAVTTEIIDAVAGPIAAVHTKAPLGQVGGPLIAALDKVYALFRERGIKGGHNVAVYYGLENGVVAFAAGVQVSEPIEPSDDVVNWTTPAGRAVRAVHMGDYTRIPATGNDVRQQCADRNIALSGLSWEVYGDHDPDVSKVRTDLYFQLAPEARA